MFLLLPTFVIGFGAHALIGVKTKNSCRHDYVKEVDERGRINLSVKRADKDFIKPNERDAKIIKEERVA